MANAELLTPSAGADSIASASSLPFGWLAYLGAGGSMLVCFDKVIILAIIGVFGVSLSGFNPHLQAVLMWALGVVALYGFHKDRKSHHKTYPLVSNGVGIVAALLNQNARLQQLKHAVELQAGEFETLNSNLEHRVPVASIHTRVAVQAGRLDRPVLASGLLHCNKSVRRNKPASKDPTRCCPWG